VLYFVTSSDSGSLVIDCLTANGNPHPPVLQRIFWSATEGAVAMALLKTGGGSQGLQALQAVSIIAGVPYTIVICLMCKGLWDILAEEYDRYYNIQRHEYDEWVTPLLDVLDYPTFSVSQALKTALAVVAPWYYAARGAAWADGVRVLYYKVRLWLVAM
jgi:choline-glycine betaine transporter